MSKSVRKYRAAFEYEAREVSELSMKEGDVITVRPLPSGAWPNAAKWMKGTNERTGMSGEFPGNYTEFKAEEDIPPTPPPRRRPNSIVMENDSTIEVSKLRTSRSAAGLSSLITESSSNGTENGRKEENLTVPKVVIKPAQNGASKSHSWEESTITVPFKCAFCK